MLNPKESIQNLDSFLDEIKELILPYRGFPESDTLAWHEISMTPEMAIQLRVAFGQYWILFETACDHAAAVPKLYQEPAVSVAPWSCVRGLLEAASVATWLADPLILSKERVSRSYARRYEELKQQLRFVRTIGDSDMVAVVSKRIAHLTAESSRLGFGTPNDKHGRQIGIAIEYPYSTGLIKLTLDQESDYRLLSSFAHAETWAVHQGSFRKRTNGNTLDLSGYDLEDTKLEKFIHPEAVNYLCWTSIAALSRALLNGFKLFGGNINALSSGIERRYVASKVASWHHTFWRSQ